MKYRNVLATAAVLGMLAVTGCSRGALPENNEANYNGERLVRSVSRHTHEMENRVENAAENTTRGFTRGINRNRQNRHSGIRTNEVTTNESINTGQINRHQRTTPMNRNTRGLNRTTENYHDVNNRDFANEGRHEAGYNRVNNRTHRIGTPDYALHYDTNSNQSIPVSLTDEGTANFFKKSGTPATKEPAANPTPNATTPQPAQ